MKTKYKAFFIILTLLGILFFTFMLKKKAIKEAPKENIKIELGENSVDPEKLWRGYFEDKLEESQTTSQDQITDLKALLKKDFEKASINNQNEISNLKENFTSAHNMLKERLEEVIELHNRSSENDSNYEPGLSILNMSDNNSSYMPPYDSATYIPETAYVTGVLMGGIAVSTSVGSASNPVPVIIRVTDQGNIPPEFQIKMKNCRILGSSYGDISSERAMVRAETLVCQQQKKIITTKISGLVYGDDGMNGIKGRVIDMSSKHIKNATIGSILSGLGNSLKPENAFSISSFGAISSKPLRSEQRLKDNMMQGMGNAAEKIANYYIKQAENMSPILQIPGGTKVDILFTKGASLGSTDIHKRINAEKR